MENKMTTIDIFEKKTCEFCYSFSYSEPINDFYGHLKNLYKIIERCSNCKGIEQYFLKLEKFVLKQKDSFHEFSLLCYLYNKFKLFDKNHLYNLAKEYEKKIITYIMNDKELDFFLGNEIYIICQIYSKNGKKDDIISFLLKIISDLDFKKLLQNHKYFASDLLESIIKFIPKKGLKKTLNEIFTNKDNIEFKEYEKKEINLKYYKGSNFENFPNYEIKLNPVEKDYNNKIFYIEKFEEYLNDNSQNYSKKIISDYINKIESDEIDKSKITPKGYYLLIKGYDLIDDHSNSNRIFDEFNKCSLNDFFWLNNNEIFFNYYFYKIRILILRKLTNQVKSELKQLLKYKSEFYPAQLIILAELYIELNMISEAKDIYLSDRLCPVEDILDYNNNNIYIYQIFYSALTKGLSKNFCKEILKKNLKVNHNYTVLEEIAILWYENYLDEQESRVNIKNIIDKYINESNCEYGQFHLYFVKAKMYFILLNDKEESLKYISLAKKILLDDIQNCLENYCFDKSVCFNIYRFEHLLKYKLLPETEIKEIVDKVLNLFRLCSSNNIKCNLQKNNLQIISDFKVQPLIAYGDLIGALLNNNYKNIVIECFADISSDLKKFLKGYSFCSENSVRVILLLFIDIIKDINLFDSVIEVIKKNLLNIQFMN